MSQTHLLVRDFEFVCVSILMLLSKGVYNINISCTVVVVVVTVTTIVVILYHPNCEHANFVKDNKYKNNKPIFTYLFKFNSNILYM